MNQNDISTATGELFATNIFVRDFCFLGESIGLAREEFAKRIGLSLTSIEDPQVVISKHYIVKGYTIILEYSDDEFLGAGTAKLPRGSVDLMVKSACTEQTLAQAIKAIEQVIRISQSPVNSTTIIEGSLVRWQFIPKVKDPRFSLLISALCTCMGHKVLSTLIKKEIPLKYSHFMEDKPKNISDYQFLFACPVKFNQQHCELAFDIKWLKQPIKCNYQEVKSYLDIPLSLITYSFQTLGFIRQIKDILSACPYARFPNQLELAEQLGVSVRTMQRKLDAENSNYMQIKDDIRQRKAIFYLEHTDKRLDEVAERCGFSEMASFTRAFIRWTGYSPSKYKK